MAASAISTVSRDTSCQTQHFHGRHRRWHSCSAGCGLAIIQRHQSGEGQVVDVALYESIFNLLEGIVPEFDGAGVMREPSGTTITGIVPTNTYLCKDGKHVVIGGNGDSIFKRLMTEAGRSDMAEDPELAHNPGRVVHQERIDKALIRLVR